MPENISNHGTIAIRHIHPCRIPNKVRKIIDQAIEEDLHAYMGAALKNLNSPALKINSMPDHIHILLRQSKNHSISNIMQIVKKDSSKWMKTRGYKNFRWQTGYGAFSISQSKVDIVRNFIINQKEHHRRRSHEQEVEKFMAQHNIEEYSREYYWE